jgi:hypothetical protein
MERYTNQHEGQSGPASHRFRSIEALLSGLVHLDKEDTGNAGFAWVNSVFSKLAAKPHYMTGSELLVDVNIARSYELIGREYVRYANWHEAANAFIGAGFHAGSKRPKWLRMKMAQFAACALRGGEHDVVTEWMESIGPVTHPVSRIYFDVLEKIIRDRVDRISDHDLSILSTLGPTVQGYTISCATTRMAAHGQYDRALRVLDRTIADLGTAGAAPWIIADLEQQSASIRVATKDYVNSRNFATSAWAKFDLQRYRACSHEQRQSLWLHFAPSRYAAIRSSVELGDGQAVAELIESCRLQSILATEIEIDNEPDRQRLAATGVATSTAEESEKRPAVKSINVSATMFNVLSDGFASTRFQSPSLITFEGRSHLQPKYTLARSGRPLPTSPLEKALPPGLLWASHIENDTLFWFVAGGGKVVGFGMQHLSEIPHIRPVLRGLAGTGESEPETWALSSRLSRPGEIYEPLTHLGSWNSAEEQIISATIGAVLPPPVVNALTSASSETPLDLTIAPSREFGCIPWPIAIVPGASKRLIELAVLRMWTSAPTQLRRRHRISGPNRDPVPLLLTVENADGTLRERGTDSVVFTAEHVLGGKESPDPATVERLQTLLWHTGANTHGLFYYRGHAHHDTDPAWSVLPLADGEPVAAGELFGAFDTSTPYLPMPSHVIWSCCSSSTSALMTGESVGLAAGAIQAGADSVIATSTNVLDASFTNAFDDLLVTEILRNEHDHATILRELQLRMLKEWSVFSVRGMGDYRHDIKDPHPTIWASYQAY